MTNKIKILFTIPNFDTAGSGRVVYDLVKGLDRSQFSPEICCEHDRGEFFNEIKTLNVPIHIFKVSTEYYPLLSLPIRISRISRFFKSHKFDLIHSWNWSSDFTEPFAARLAGVPFIYTKKAMGWGNKAWRWRSNLSSKIVVINKDMAPIFFENYRDKVAYLPLGVDTEKFRPMTADENLKSNLGIKDSDFVLISVANLVPVKGIEILIEALRKLNDPDIQLLIVGADHSDYAKNLLSKYSNSQIKFLGPQNDVRPYIALADVFVIPTKDEGRKEGLPLAPLEAMAMGKPVLGSDIPGVRDILQNHPESLFEPSNSSQLSKLILKIKLLPHDKRQQLGMEMLKTVEKSFTLKLSRRRHAELYCQVLSG